MGSNPTPRTIVGSLPPWCWGVVVGVVFLVFSVFCGFFGVLLGLCWCCVVTVLLLVCLSGCGVVLSVGGLEWCRVGGFSLSVRGVF